MAGPKYPAPSRAARTASTRVNEIAAEPVAAAKARTYACKSASVGSA